MFHHKYAANHGLAILVAACVVALPATAMDTPATTKGTPTTAMSAPATAMGKPTKTMDTSATAMGTSTAAMDAFPNVPFAPNRWQVRGDVQFIKQEGYLRGIMTLGDDASAKLKDFSFGNGTIEFDAKASSDGEVGINFRRDEDSTEQFYVRVKPDCAASQDCLQYIPITHGRGLWDAYIQYENSAPFVPDQWNHIKMVVSGRRMNVFVNRQATPSLSVGRLEGDELVGGIALQGPASYASLVITPNAVEGLPPEPEADPTASDHRYLRTWDVAPPTRLAEGAEPKATDIPPASAAWETVHAEDYGLMNLARRNDELPKGDNIKPLIGWLKTSVQSDRDQTQHVSIGFLREVWVFVDGKLVYADQNRYYTPSQKKYPDGRLSIDNASFDLPLHKGANQVVIALRSNTTDMQDHYGWGMELRLQDLKGITLVR